MPATTTDWCSRAETVWAAQVACRLHPCFLSLVSSHGFDGGSDDTEGSLSWDSRKYPAGAARAGHEDGRWRRWRTRLGPRARSAESPTSWASTPRLCAPGSRRPRSTRAPGPAPPPTRHSGSRSWRKRSENCEEPTRS